MTDQPEYNYEGSDLQIDFSASFASNRLTNCPISYIDCYTSSTIDIECSYTNAGTETGLYFNSVTGILTFSSADYSDAVFTPGDHTFTVTAAVGTNSEL